MDISNKMKKVLSKYISQEALRTTEVLVYRNENEDVINYFKNTYKRIYKQKKDCGFVAIAAQYNDKFERMIGYNLSEVERNVEENMWFIAEIAYPFIEDDQYIVDNIQSIEFIKIMLHEFRHVDMFVIDKMYHPFHTEYNIEKYALMCIKEMYDNGFKFESVENYLK